MKKNEPDRQELVGQSRGPGRAESKVVQGIILTPGFKIGNL